jgi:hypothetical protein
MDEAADDLFARYESSTIEALNLSERFSNLFQRVLALDPDGWHERAADHLDHLRSLRSDYDTIRAEYIHIVEELVN